MNLISPFLSPHNSLSPSTPLLSDKASSFCFVDPVLTIWGHSKKPKHLHTQSIHSSVLFGSSKAFRNTLMSTLRLSSKCPKAAPTPWTSRVKLYSQITSQEHQRVCVCLVCLVCLVFQAFNYEGTIIIHALCNVQHGKLKLYCWSILVCCADQSWFNKEHLLEALIASLISEGNIWLGWSTTFVVFTVS